MKFDRLSTNLLEAVTNITNVPQGAANIRIDGQAVVRNSTPAVSILPDPDRAGFRLEVKPGSKGETVHVPVIITKSGLQDKVYNTFIIGEEADVTIIAGCGIHNDSHAHARHDGVHEIIVRKGARLKYVEKHYGAGKGEGKRILNPTAILHVHEEASVEMEMVQIEGVDDTHRSTVAHIYKKGNLKIIERLLTHNQQAAESDIQLIIAGEGGSGQILSRSVAKDQSTQGFRASLVGRTECTGHVECDSIIMGDSRISAIPQLVAEDARAVLTHEAAIGRIAGEQLIKLMSLGLTEQQAVDTIIEGFLR